MLCIRCRQFAAVSGGSLCANCATASAASSGGLPVAPPLGDTQLPSPHGPAWLRSPVGLGKAAAALLGLVIATDLFAIWADVTMYDVTGRIADGDISAAVRRQADHADSLYSVAGITQTSALIATIVVYLIWFQRVRVNGEVFSPSGHSMRRGWTIWGWFVPIVNFWFPRRVMVDIWDASSPGERSRSHGLVNAWWTLWVVALLAGRAGSNQYRKADTAQQLHDASAQILFADVIDIAAAVLAILVVLRLTAMQNEKAQQGPVPVAV
jgi:hypothetical protein